ncbi:uncharacterized protein LOC116290539 [Actinia tenebrosa]|uniref:Uncharacterized protein LOC116290539 n=1 Tax=Actinia tenebrosa TaxID=6105 RepID=A0A6P8HEL9_ACTTE|nr:uncharacterized protein LOC116290539 [Actinia tenebrosa]
MFLRRHGGDPLAGRNSYNEGSSIINQPIESFWRHFREEGFQFWIDKFKSLQQSGKWDPGNTVHQLCLLYVYTPLLQLEVNEIKEDWNSHRIRFQRGEDRPCGVPNDLYEFPALKGAKEMKKNVLASDAVYIREKYNFNQQLVYLPKSFKDEADLYVNSTGRIIDITTASKAYDELVTLLSS